MTILSLTFDECPKNADRIIPQVCLVKGSDEVAKQITSAFEERYPKIAAREEKFGNEKIPQFLVNAKFKIDETLARKEAMDRKVEKIKFPGSN